MKKLIILIATGTYLGKIPVMPGTFGTLWGVAIAWLASGLPLQWRALAVFAVIAASMAVSGEAVKILGRHDHPSIVADEVSGFLVAMFLLPFTAFNAILVFILFRFFDIVKPFPAGLIDRRMKGGAGVVLDDVAAGAYANISAQILLWLTGRL